MVLNMKVKLHFILIALLTFLTGCTGLSPERYLANKQEYMINQGNPPTYVAGYVDGCSSGRRLAGDKGFTYRKNNTRFEKDALYARGWQEGQINCRNEALEDATTNPGKLMNRENLNSAGMPAETAEKSAAEMEMRHIWDQLKK